MVDVAASTQQTRNRQLAQLTCLSPQQLVLLALAVEHQKDILLQSQACQLSYVLVLLACFVIAAPQSDLHSGACPMDAYS